MDAVISGTRPHVALDMGSRIVRRARLTPANINETSCADALICGDEHAVYADKAYDSKGRSAALKARGIRNRIMRRWHWSWPPPSRWQQRRNALLVIRRAPIEPLFALLKSVYRFCRARYRGLVRNAAALHLAFAAMNHQTMDHTRSTDLKPRRPQARCQPRLITPMACKRSSRHPASRHFCKALA
jgi:IS5 family transposase